MRSKVAHAPPSLHMERSPTDDYSSYGFGTTLSPVVFTARDNSISELLRFLSRVAASKPTS